MKIFFDSSELARVCNDDGERAQVYGEPLASTLRRRLGEISAASHLAELRRFPAVRLRQDATRGDGSLLVALGRVADLRVRPRYDPPPILPDGRLDEFEVRELVVAAIAVAA
ncbi:hypothetical protein ACIRG5_47380 [Lentzea sp. NPDC102401]|uniref:hypothetical protein n=1 Tax=Lentzea sp. NPDC102401 TaxID=3364128 RepID=UPI0037FCD6DF